MIVLSGLLVLVSIVLLVLGLADEESLTLVYFSIGTSIVAGVLLILGALQRRGEAPATAEASAGAAGADTGERVTTVSVTRPTVTTPVEESLAATGAGPTVSVVPGRPRYHVSGCRFLAGRNDVTEMALSEAKDESYTACGVCKPDEALAAYAGTSSAVVDAPPEDPEVETLLETPAERARSRAAAAGSSGARKAAATSGGRTAAKAVGRTATVKPAPPRPTATKTAAAKAAPAKAAAKATPAKAAAKAAPAKAAAKATPAKAAAKAAPAKAAPAKATKATKAAPAKATGTTVVVIPDRDKFHTGDCRFVKGVAGTVSVAKATARRQGYEPCGVCKP